jgi:hypothetical protein
MFQDPRIAGSWPELVARLDEAGQMQRWAVGEPALRAAVSVAELAALTTARANPERSDAVCGALVRIAAGAAPDSQDAVLVLVHLLSPGLGQLAGEFADLTLDPLEIAVGALTVQIRSYGVGPRGGQRRRAFAANLLRDTRRALLRELRPHCTPRRPNSADELIDPTDRERIAEVFDQALPGPGEDEELDLVDVLVWAERTGVACSRDLEVLVEAERSSDRSAGAAGQRHIAAALGIHQSTLRRRRARALAALQNASARFPAWLAA